MPLNVIVLIFTRPYEVEIYCFTNEETCTQVITNKELGFLATWSEGLLLAMVIYNALDHCVLLVKSCLSSVDF